MPPYQKPLTIQWNQLTLDAIKITNTPPPLAARALAMVHTAIYDAWSVYNKCAFSTTTSRYIKRYEENCGENEVEKTFSYAVFRVLAHLFWMALPAENRGMFRNLMIQYNYNPGGINATWAFGGIAVDGGLNFTDEIHDNHVTDNIVFSVNPYQYVIDYYSENGSWNEAPGFGILDSNYYVKIDGPSTLISSRQTAIGLNGEVSLATWQAGTGKDIHSQGPPIPVTSTDSLRVEYNATDNPVTIALDQKYIDVRSNIYDGSITLQPWRSAILIKDGEATTGLTENENTTSISIFPNPMNDHFTVEGATQISSIKVVDLSGRTMKRFEPNSSNVYSISGLASGTYLVVITDGSLEVSKHIVKQ